MEWKVNVAAVLCLKTTDVECWRSVSLNKSLTCHNTEHQQSCEARHVGDVGQCAEWRVRLLVPLPCAKCLLAYTL